MNQKFAISVIMAVCNGEKYLKESIESILNQDFPDFEFIIVDDYSRDNSKKIIKKYLKSDKRIRLMENRKNIGLTRSLNKALSLAKGRYIARQDDDDVSLPQRFREQYDFLENNPEIVLCGTNYHYLNENNEIITKKKKNFPLSYREIKQRLPKKNCFFHSTIMFKNQGFRYREKFYYSQDYDFYLRLLSSGEKMINLSKALVLWRINRDSISLNFHQAQKMFGENARKMFFLRKKNKNDNYDHFNAQEICKKPIIKSKKETFVETRLNIFLQNQNFRQAKLLFEESFERLVGMEWYKKKAYSIFVNYPIIYKIYRKIRY